MASTATPSITVCALDAASSEGLLASARAGEEVAEVRKELVELCLEWKFARVEIEGRMVPSL